MQVQGRPYRSIHHDPVRDVVEIIDQRWLPHAFRVVTLESLEDFAIAIRDMWVRGAPLIGATAAWGIARQMRRRADDGSLLAACATLQATRPTAVNLSWALARMRQRLLALAPAGRAAAARTLAGAICDEDVRTNEAIGEHGLALLQALAPAPAQPGAPLRLLTHCNAGWLATVDRGTATAPIYRAHEAGLPIHVWVDETRPRNQGASLTCWELGEAGVPHTLVADNAGGHLMQHGQVDAVIVGADRVTARGDVCNKIGTYLKALAARDNAVPFYVAVPSSTIDWTLDDGVAEVPIEIRDGREITEVSGAAIDAGPPDAGSPDAASPATRTVRIAPTGTRAHNPAFDVTPARLVTGLITEWGIFEASTAGLSRLRRRLDAGPDAGPDEGSDEDSDAGSDAGPRGVS